MDIDTPESKFDPLCYYYVYAYACNSRGTAKYLYIGKYDVVKEIVEKGGFINARTMSNVDCYREIDNETLVWRVFLLSTRKMVGTDGEIGQRIAVLTDPITDSKVQTDCKQPVASRGWMASSPRLKPV